MTVRESGVGSWEEPANIWLTVAKNAFVGWALNFRVRMLLKGTLTPFYPVWHLQFQNRTPIFKLFYSCFMSILRLFSPYYPRFFPPILILFIFYVYFNTIFCLFSKDFSLLQFYSCFIPILRLFSIFGLSYSHYFNTIFSSACIQSRAIFRLF